MSLEGASRPFRAALEARGLDPTAITLVMILTGILVATTLALTGRWVLTRHLRALAAKTTSQLDDIVVDALDGPVVALGAFVGAALGLLASPVSDATRSFASNAIMLGVGVTALIVAARLANAIILTYGERAHLALPTRSLLRRLVVALIFVLGALMLLDGMGVRVTALITTLGLAGLALALALQDTLTNFFSGIYVQADKPISEGHYVRIEEANVEGYVEEVGWRTTKIRTLGNNLVVIPNAKVASSIVTDYELPQPRMSLLVRIPVQRDADSRRVEAILVEEAEKAAAEVEGLLASPEPFVRFIPGFTEQGQEFTLICQVRTFVDQYLAQHEIRHRVAQRLAREGIQLGVPYRDIVSTATRSMESRSLSVESTP